MFEMYVQSFLKCIARLCFYSILLFAIQSWFYSVVKYRVNVICLFYLFCFFRSQYCYSFFKYQLYRFVLGFHYNVCLLFSQLKFNICERCNMPLTGPMYRNKPNITYFLTYSYTEWQILFQISFSLSINCTCYQYNTVGKYCNLCVQFVWLLDCVNWQWNTMETSFINFLKRAVHYLILLLSTHQWYKGPDQGRFFQSRILIDALIMPSKACGF